MGVIRGFYGIEALMNAVRNEWPDYETRANFSAYLANSYLDITITDATDGGDGLPEKKYCLNLKSYDEGSRIKGMLPDLFPGIYIYNAR